MVLEVFRFFLLVLFFASTLEWCLRIVRLSWLVGRINRSQIPPAFVGVGVGVRAGNFETVGRDLPRPMGRVLKLQREESARAKQSHRAHHLSFSCVAQEGVRMAGNDCRLAIGTEATKSLF